MACAPCYITGKIVQRTVTGGGGAQRRPAGGISDGAVRARVGVLTIVSTGRSKAAAPGRRRRDPCRRPQRGDGRAGSHGPVAQVASSEPGSPPPYDARAGTP